MVYSDILKNGLLLPQKSKYTKRDFKKLVKAGNAPKEARFICLCSAIYYGVEYSKFFNSLKTRIYFGL